MESHIEYPEIGICGISCRFCPHYHTEGTSRCGGCKSEYRRAVGCPFITCAIKKKGIESCCSCDEYLSCEKIKKHAEFSRTRDTFVCYQKIEENLDSIHRNGIRNFNREQREKAKLLEEMLLDFNDGRSKSYYCIASTVFLKEELITALQKTRKESSGLDLKENAKILRSHLENIARKNGYWLKLRK